MSHVPTDHKMTESSSGSLVVFFRRPARKFLISTPLCDQYGSLVDLRVAGRRYYVNESPMVVQPDYLVDDAAKRIVGLTFELSSPGWMLPRCNEMLVGLDTTSIHVTKDDNENVRLDTIWAEAHLSKKVFAQLDFGVWGFLYSVKNPSLLRGGDKWTTPEGLVIGNLRQLAFPALIATTELGDVTIELA